MFFIFVEIIQKSPVKFGYYFSRKVIDNNKKLCYNIITVKGTTQKKKEFLKMKNVMKRAWEIYRTLTGKHLEKLSKALKRAWVEIKTVANKVNFGGYAKVAKTEKVCGDCSYLTFKGWENYGKKRIYINDYKRRTLGYIENGEVIIKDNQGNFKSEIDFAINSFMATYNF